MKWFLGICFSLFLAVQDSSAQCDVGWYSAGANCFYFDTQERVPFNQARNICNSLRQGADLAINLDADTHREIYNYINVFGLSGSFWLGGSDEAFEGDWKWVDDTRIEFGTPYWAMENGLLGWDQEPLGGTLQNCLILDSQRYFYWDDQDCFGNNHPLCMY